MIKTASFVIQKEMNIGLYARTADSYFVAAVSALYQHYRSFDYYQEHPPADSPAVGSLDIR